MFGARRKQFDANSLQPLEAALHEHSVAREHFRCVEIYAPSVQRYLNPDEMLEFDGLQVSELELARLAYAPDGSILSIERRTRADDGAPPGLYLIVEHGKLIQPNQKNAVGIYRRWFWGRGVFIDNIFFVTDPKRKGLGTVGFALLAIGAFRLGVSEIALLAGGGSGRYIEWPPAPPMWGYKVWPKFGFDALLHPGEIDGAAHLKGCKTVLDVLERDENWWGDNGDGRFMKFDLHPDSRSWVKLLTYLKHSGVSP